MEFDIVRVAQYGMDPRVASFAEIAMASLLMSLIAGRVQLMEEQSCTIWVTREEVNVGAVFTTLIVNGESNVLSVHIEQVPIADRGGDEKSKVSGVVRVIQEGSIDPCPQRPTNAVVPNKLECASV